RVPIRKRQSPVKKTNGGVRSTGRRRRKCDCRSLEREINPAAHHAEVVIWTVNKVPAEIINPANVRREADFEATTDLADCLRPGTVVDEIIVRFIKASPFAAAEDRAASAKNIG